MSYQITAPTRWLHIPHIRSLPKVFTCILYVSYQITALGTFGALDLHMLGRKALTWQVYSVHVSLFTFLSVIVDEYKCTLYSVQCVSIRISICNWRWIFTGEGVKACRHPGSPKVPTGSELTRFHTAHHTSIIHTHTFPSFALLNIVLASTAHTHHTSILHNYLYVHSAHHTGFHSTHIVLHFIALPLDNELPFVITFLTTLLTSIR